MPHKKLIQQIKKNNIPPVMMLYGTESFFIQDVRQALMDEISKTDEDFVSIYDLEETPIEVVLEDAETYPFLSERKLIIAENPFFLTNKRVQVDFEHDLTHLESYLENPAPYTHLLFIAPYESIDRRKKITKYLNKEAYVVECQPIKAHDFKSWINSIAEELNIRIKPDVIPIFEGELANDLHILRNELEKIALYVGEDGLVTKSVVHDLLSQTLSGSAFRLVDAIMNRNLKDALTTYKLLEKMNEKKVGLISLIASQFRMIYQVKLLKRKGYTEKQMVQEVSAHPYVVKLANQRERKFSDQQLTHYIDRMAEADAMIKRGEVEDNIAFELLLYDLITA